jgi:hypothetical protein
MAIQQKRHGMGEQNAIGRSAAGVSSVTVQA